MIAATAGFHKGSWLQVLSEQPLTCNLKFETFYSGTDHLGEKGKFILQLQTEHIQEN